MKKWIAEHEEIVDIVGTLQPTNQSTNEYEVLEIVLRRGSPLHRLWQDIHLAKYPEHY